MEYDAKAGVIIWLTQLEEMGEKTKEKGSSHSRDNILVIVIHPLVKIDDVNTFIEHLLYTRYGSISFSFYNLASKQLLVCFQRKHSQII